MIAPTEQQNQTEIDPAARDEAAKQQSLVPLFALASVVMGVGFFFALQPPSETKAANTDSVKPISPTLTPPSNLRTDVTPQVLAYRASEATHHIYKLEQKSARGDREVTTRVTTNIAMKPKGDVWAVSLSDTKLSIQGASGALGAGVSSQLQTVLNKSQAQMKMRPSGKITSWDWTSRTNPQVRQTLRLLQDAVALMTPRFDARAVAPGESWSYDVDLGSAKGARGLAMDGALKVQAKLLGSSTLKGRTVLVISHDLSLQESGTLGDAKHTTAGKGKALVFFDPMQGNVVQHDLSLDVTLSASDQKQRMSYTFLLATP